MRELSPQEEAFLARALGEGASGSGYRNSRDGRALLSPIERASAMAKRTLRYLPLAIGSLTLALAALATYLYIWGREFFKVSEMEKMRDEGTLLVLDDTANSWVRGSLDFFGAMPWIILGLVLLGILLMGATMLLTRKKNDG